MWMQNSCVYTAVILLTFGIMALLQDFFHSAVGTGVSQLLSCLASLYSLAQHACT